MSSRIITRWEPEHPTFWQQEGKAIARRNLWISIPALTLAFIIWQVWSVAVLNMPNIGFRYSENQLFWLAALPALSGATLRIFYSFMVPVFGGRKWMALSTASLLIPAIGIGHVQHRHAPHLPDDEGQGERGDGNPQIAPGNSFALLLPESRMLRLPAGDDATGHGKSLHLRARGGRPAGWPPARTGQRRMGEGVRPPAGG
jgi:hypothetical protein